ELAARVGAVARRPDAPAGLEEVAFGDVVIDLPARTLTVAGRAVPTTRRELDLLIHLVRHPATSFTRQELLENVWSSSADWQKEATVTEHVRRLRAKV